MKSFGLLRSASAGALLVGLSGGAASAAEVEVMHWWTSGGEQAAVSVFAREFEEGGDTWKDTAIAGGPNARAAMMQRTLGGDPPGAAQFNPGRQYEELIEAGLLLDLTELAEEEGWADLVNPPNILDPCLKDGHVWCVPVNIHSWQWAWASIPVFEQSGVELPNNLDEFLAAAPKIQEAGFIPFAIGGETWQHSGALNVVLLSQVGGEGWNRLYRDRDAEFARGAEVRKALEIFRELVSYRDEGSANRNWNDTTNLVITDKAALQIMGDWARGEFAIAEEVPGVDYACIPGPSEDPYLDTGGDIFLFPKSDDPEVEAAQLRMASMMISPEVQVEFNLAKGSLPVRGDIDMSAADDCMQKGLKLLENPDRVVKAVNKYLTEDGTGQLNDLFAEFITNPDLSVDEAQERYAQIIENAD
jgi:glucose/mannose transport system substrate-binding protein